MRMRRKPGAHLLGSLLLMAIAAMPAGLAAQVKDAGAACRGSTIDNQGTKIAKESREFLAHLQAAVRANNKEQIAGMVRYPLLVLHQRERMQVRTRSSFLENYDLIFTEPVREAVLHQTSRCLFGNADGAMVGQGEVWFSRMAAGGMKIITVNDSMPPT